ncbi:hypothetical protein EKO27_g3165 [Xylaria grammica]|uniref:DOMON domain-containing protein n=1 Tax=Xylaria grammica TaxID=363999 RepID=A0A439DC19_9PEZI|nr:hypothetical protein EKO27_g3165 [Xylaria grammica]
MRWNLGLAYLAALLGCASEGSAADTTIVRDGETGFTFSEYQAAFVIGQAITFRVAVPSPAPDKYDLVFQIIAPTAVGWTGLAWGASMVNDPLTIGWASGSTAVVSVRRTTVRTQPQVYDGATVQLLRTGTRVNGTHWQITAKCSGCSSFTTTGSTTKNLNPTGSNRLAFAYSKTRPNSASTAAMISVHDVYSYWDHDFSTAGNIDFAQLVQKNA